MPELVEVERYRSLAEAAALGRLVSAVDAPDAWYLKQGAEADAVAATLVGERFVAARRRGKLLMLDTSGAAVLGLHFGMSGRLLVDGLAGVDRLLYSPVREEARYDRFRVVFADGGVLAVRDPRRLGGVVLDPEEDRLGPDALTVTLPELRRALSGAGVALKARLLDQSRLAGVGNLIADEVLWRAGLAPARPAGGLSARAVGRLHAHLGTGIAELIERGGSHTGDLMPERRAGGVCPRDATPLVRSTVGGRTTFWCPRHQR